MQCLAKALNFDFGFLIQNQQLQAKDKNQQWTWILDDPRIVLISSNCSTGYIYFTKSQHVATSSFIPVWNHQATNKKINKLTIIVLESADPYLPDRVEFKHISLLNLRQDMLFIRAAGTYLDTTSTDLWCSISQVQHYF